MKNSNSETQIDFATLTAGLEPSEQAKYAKFFVKDNSDSININKKTDGSTALHIAAHYGHEQVAKRLIDRGANLEIVDNIGLTPISWSAGKGHINITKELIDRGANLDKPENQSLHGGGRQTALMAAFACKEPVAKEEIVKLLLKSGAPYKGTPHIEHPELESFKENPIQYVIDKNDTNEQRIKALHNLEKYNPENNRLKKLIPAEIERIEKFENTIKISDSININKIDLRQFSVDSPQTAPITPSSSPVSSERSNSPTQQKKGFLGKIRSSLGI